ncbi:MAG TPA: hypothetical protein VI541_05565 [Actinomycetota bacterium]|nr:hypothetical protein [Actinomycetota bacterium]
MEVDYAFIAESADAQNGLFYVVRGGTDVWYVPAGSTYPLPIGPMSLVIRLSGERSEIGRQLPVSFTIVDADGRPIGIEGNGEIVFGEHGVDRTRTGGALLHFRLGFAVPAQGAFIFQLFSDGQRLCQVPFWIVESPNTPK